MVNRDNSKMMGFLIIAGGGLSLSQEHLKEWRKRRQWVCPWIRKRDIKGAYYSIINDLRLRDKEDFRKHSFLKQNITRFHFFCTFQMDTVYQNVLYNSCLLLFLRHGILYTKEQASLLHKWGFIGIYSKNNFCIMSKIKPVWFYSLYRNYYLE